MENQLNQINQPVMFRNELKMYDPELYDYITNRRLKQDSYYMKEPKNKSEEMDMNNHFVYDNIQRLITQELVIQPVQNDGYELHYMLPNDQFTSIKVFSKNSINKIKLAVLDNSIYDKSYSKCKNPGQTFEIVFSKPVDLCLSAMFTPGSRLVLCFENSVHYTDEKPIVALQLCRDLGRTISMNETMEEVTQLYHQNPSHHPDLVFPSCEWKLL